MSKYRMAKISAILNFIGALLVFLAFGKTTSTGFVVYTNGSHGESAMCVGDPPRSMLAVGPNGEFLMGMRALDPPAPQGKHTGGWPGLSTADTITAGGAPSFAWFAKGGNEGVLAVREPKSKGAPGEFLPGRSRCGRTRGSGLRRRALRLQRLRSR